MGAVRAFFKSRSLSDWVLLGAAVVSFVRLLAVAQLGLGDDEAYYWEWSRRLELSYYDHPAMIAWLIRAGTELFGQSALGVRSFGFVCQAVTTALLWGLANRIFGATTAAITVVFFLLSPLFNIGGFLMVPDSPMFVAWAGTVLLVWRILIEGDDRWRVWLTAGLTIGLGFLSKYTIALLAVSILLLICSEGAWRRHFRRPKLWAAMIVAIACTAPIILWNASHGWPTFRYHLHDRQMGGGGADFNRWGAFFASQLVALGPTLFLFCFLVCVIGFLRWSDRRWRFLTVLSLPTFIVFCVQALFADFKVHWPAPSYFLALIGASELFRVGLRSHSWSWKLITGLGLAVALPINLIFYVDVFDPIVPKIARSLVPGVEWDPKYDPLNDFFGWDVVADEVRKIRDEFKDRGEAEPFLASSRYQLVAQLAFATQQSVWRVVAEKDQYAFWQTPEKARSLVGRDAIFVTDQRYDRDPRTEKVFESCQSRAPLAYYRAGEISHWFNLWICRNYQPLGH